MASWRQQALIEAPVETVWELVGDPSRHPQWWPDVIEVKGIPRITEDAKYRQVTRERGRGTVETTFNIEELDELRTIKVRCLDSGTYGDFRLTEVRGQTFADVELGIDPTNLRYRLFDWTQGKRYFRHWTEAALDGLKEAAERAAAPAG
jgi:uncharacterized protein YndB with AHSA1/START domain